MNYQNLLKSLLKHEIRIAYEEAASPLSLGASKIGGKPHLPSDFTWCRYDGESYDGERKDRPLAFLMQINLAEVAPFDKDGLLPKRGMLYFFYEPESMRWGFLPDDKGSARVFYYDIPADELCETDLPEDLDRQYTCAECALTFSAVQNLPSYEEFSEHVDGEYGDWDEYEEAVSGFGIDTDYDSESIVKLLGYADIIQSEMLSECEMVTRNIDCGHGPVSLSEDTKADIKEKSLDWILLCQIGTITTENNEWMWGDCGCLYFYIRKDDLATRNFDNIWMILQCY